jgi:hypothetical protein
MSNKVKIKKKHLKKGRVAIVGKGPGRSLAPKPGEGADVWGTNNVCITQPVDMAFDMHNFNWTLEEHIENYSHLAHMMSEDEIYERAKYREFSMARTLRYVKEHGITLMSQQQYEGFEKNKSMSYPLKKIIEAFDSDLFPSVVPYMIAYAIYMNYTYIDLYGVNCVHGEEWAYQRGAIEGWLMYAKAKKIIVTVNGLEDRPLRLFDGKLYGYGIPQSTKGDLYRETLKLAHDQENPDPNETQDKEFYVWKE